MPRCRTLNVLFIEHESQVNDTELLAWHHCSGGRPRSWNFLLTRGLAFWLLHSMREVNKSKCTTTCLGLCVFTRYCPKQEEKTFKRKRAWKFNIHSVFVEVMKLQHGAENPDKSFRTHEMCPVCLVVPLWWGVKKDCEHIKGHWSKVNHFKDPPLWLW